MEVITLDQLANVMRAYPLKGIVSRQEFDALYVGGSRIDLDNGVIVLQRLLRRDRELGHLGGSIIALAMSS